MGRKIKIRVNYIHDVVFLNRLQQAVSEDPRASDDYKREVSQHIHRLIAIFSLDDKRREEFVAEQESEA